MDDRLRLTLTEDQAESALLRQRGPGRDPVSAARVARELATLDYSACKRSTGATKHAPGTVGKLAVMEGRALRKESLCHPDDAPIGRRTVVNTEAMAGQSRPNGSKPLGIFAEIGDQEWLSEEELDAIELAAEGAAYDEVAKSYRRGTPEWDERHARDLAWQEAGVNVTWLLPDADTSPARKVA